MKRILAVLVILCPFLTKCKPLEFTGTIINEQSKRVGGATVLHKRTGNTITANNKGEFFITNLNINDTLVITAAGYKPDTVVFSFPGRGELTFIIRSSHSSNQQHKTNNKNERQETRNGLKTPNT